MDLNFDQKNIALILPELPREQLEGLVLQQATLIEQLQTRVSELEKQLEELHQQPPTSTAPFRRDKNRLSKNRKKSGQKKGHQGFFRLPPPPTEIIDVPLDYCPDCFSHIEHLRHHTQTIEELPIIIPQVIQIKTQSGYCKNCRKKVRSSHPLQISKAQGAASTALGPQAKAVAIELQHRFHLTKSKTCAILKEFFGINLTRGGLVNLSHRVAARLQPKYHQLQLQVQQSSHIHADETGWYVGASGHQLCVFTNRWLTFYQITESRTRELVKRILGANYKGVLITDCLSIYDEVNRLQQKCYAHHFRSIKAALEKISGGVSDYLEEIKLLLQTAMTLKSLQAELKTVELAARIQHLETWAANLLRLENRPAQLQPEEETIRRRLFKQRDHLFEFLKHREVEATNNQAERQLRPAVIARKLSCGNRTAKGAKTWEVLASLSVTTKQRNESFKDLIAQSIFGVPP